MSLHTLKTESKLEQSRMKLVEVDKKYSQMEWSSQQQVTAYLENELEFLLERKEREIQKKKRLQELEEIYQRERQQKVEKIQNKIDRSDHNRQKSLKEKKVKVKMNNDLGDKIKKKKDHENEEEIQKMLQRRKDYLRGRKSQSRSSKESLKDETSRSLKSKYRNLSFSKPNDSKIDEQMQRIESKLDQAKTKSLFFQKKIIEKAKECYKDMDKIVQKARTNSVMEETSCFREYFQRATHIIECQEKSKSFYAKSTEKKKKLIDEKFKKCTQNLKYIDRERQSKLDDLQTKFQKTHAPKSWRNEKNTIYLQKFLKNQKEIEQQQMNKAESILKKHLDITLKNKAIREQKDKILQTVKKMDA